MKSIKRIRKICAVIFLSSFVCGVMSISAFAADGTSMYSSLSAQINKAEEKDCITYGLDVIAYQNQMTVAGVEGNALNFSAQRFACAMNLSDIDYITVTQLPEISCGSLYIGSEGVSVGQRISASALSLMTYEEAKTGIGVPTSFKFTVNDSVYEMICNIQMIDKVNYSPTLTMASGVSLNIETYRDIMVDGVLSAYDPEGDELKYEIVKYPSHGRVILENASLGTYSYIPDDSYTGGDSFVYVAQDEYGNYSASAKVSVTVFAQVSTTVYNDLLDDALYSHAISMTENGLMNGVQVGAYQYFEADRTVSRADFLVTAMNAIGIKNVPDAVNTGFEDDADISPEMKGYISIAYSKGYISGIKSDGKIYFRPDDRITLSEAAVIVSNMIGYAKAEVAPAFADADSIPSWSSKAIESLYTLGILEFPDKTVCAGENITRGDMAKLLNKTMQVIGR